MTVHSIVSLQTQAPALNRIAEHLVALYGDNIGRKTLVRIEALMANCRTRVPARSDQLTERDAILITYADQVREPNAPPLSTLADFCAEHLSGVVSGVHILPFYPHSSDDGFSVIDYRAVSPMLGSWRDVGRLGARFRLMFDAVMGHVSASGEWFQGFLRDDPRYRDYFIVVPDDSDLSRVVRPRTSPLLTEFVTPSGKKNVWTTFSADQIDLNYCNPDVLVDAIDTLLFYVTQGAEFIRLDAIAFLWKEIGTRCIHLPQTHRIIQLVRAVMDAVAPYVVLITETNVPHEDNVSYFGDGANEAQMVYNFALPPLTLHTFHTANATTLSRWAQQLTLPTTHVTFFNFLASHDGIGLVPVSGILSEREITALVARTQSQGGLVSYKTNGDGSSSPYELNINYMDALSDPNAEESQGTQVNRFIAAQSIMLSLAGVPGIYFHSLFGSNGWREGVGATGQKRTINREKYDRGALERELLDAGSRRHAVFTRYRQLLQVRSATDAFDPHGAMQIPELSPSVFAVLRIGSSGRSVLCLHNVSGQPQTAKLIPPFAASKPNELVDMITGQRVNSNRVAHLVPYQVLWLTGATGK